MSEPLRRSARSRKPQQPAEPSPPTAAETNGIPEDVDIEDVMTNPKSKLTRVDLSVSIHDPSPFNNVLDAELAKKSTCT